MNYSRFFLFLLLVPSIAALNLECKLSNKETFEKWTPSPNRCVVNSAKLEKPGDGAEDKILFTGSKKEMTVVDFVNSVVKFIPLEIIEQFPNLNGLMIRNSPLDIITENYFSQKFIVLKYLKISNQLRAIPKNSLINLKNLEWLDVQENKLEILQVDTFHHNTKLRYLNFRGNRINAIYLKILNLNKLEFLNFENNNCVNEKFNQTMIKSNAAIKSLALCFQNCKMIPHCAAIEKPSEFVERILGKSNQNNQHNGKGKVKVVPNFEVLLMKRKEQEKKGKVEKRVEKSAGFPKAQKEEKDHGPSNKLEEKPAKKVSISASSFVLHRSTEYVFEDRSIFSYQLLILGLLIAIAVLVFSKFRAQRKFYMQDLNTFNRVSFPTKTGNY